MSPTVVDVSCTFDVNRDACCPADLYVCIFDWRSAIGFYPWNMTHVVCTNKAEN